MPEAITSGETTFHGGSRAIMGIPQLRRAFEHVQATAHKLIASKKLSKESIDEFIRYQFLARYAKEFRRFYADNAPGLNLTCEFEGENGGTFTAGFRLGPDLFWF